MAADTAAEKQRTAAAGRSSAVGRWAVAAALCLTVAVYAWHVHGTMERRVAALEAAVAAMQERLADAPNAGAAAMGLEQPLRNKRDATSGQCLCPPGESRIVFTLSS